MGMFNEISTTEKLTCPHCGERHHWTIQFKYGACDLTRYRLGQRLDWGTNDEGEPGHPHVYADGILTQCPNCKGEMDPTQELYDIELRDDIITTVTKATGEIDYAGEPWLVVED